jgi:hypothetical protein
VSLIIFAIRDVNDNADWVALTPPVIHLAKSYPYVQKKLRLLIKTMLNWSSSAKHTIKSENLVTQDHLAKYQHGSITETMFFKRDSLTRFWYPFFISLDRFGGRNRAGSCLFFILITFSCLNFKKLCFGGKELPAHRQGINRKNFVRGLPTLAFHRINSDSAGNYQLIDVESTIRMDFSPGITSSGTGNPPKEGDSTGNY